MDLQDLIIHFRAQVSDEVQPYLWSDDEVLLYAIDAQDTFVRLTGGIADVTVPQADIGSPQTRLQDLDLTADEPYEAINPYILRIVGGRLLTATWDVTFVRQGDLSLMRWDDYGWRQGAELDDTDTGDVRYGVLGVRDGYVRWMKVPAAADTCRLQVLRLPFPRIEAQEDSLEIGGEHHLHLVKWMKYLAYSKEDSETYDKRIAYDCEQWFRNYCQRSAQEIERRRFRHRVVQYGGL